jgi:hypothetical protein
MHFVPLNPSPLLHVTYVPHYCPYTTTPRDRHPCPLQDSNPQSQQGTSCRATP